MSLKVVVASALLSLVLGAPAKLGELEAATRYNYEPPAQPSGLYETPVEVTTTTTTTTPPPPPPNSYLPPETTTTTTTTTTPPPPPPVTYLPPVTVTRKATTITTTTTPQPDLINDGTDPKKTIAKKMMPYMPYDLGYAIQDEESGNSYSHNEVNDGQETRGEYRVLLPDGRTQIVSFRADPSTGYVADVRYE